MSADLSRRAGLAPSPILGRRSFVLALVPHYRCEEWLGDCLESLLAQTRPLQGIAVIDDHSEPPPLDILRRFPRVTLLTAAENVGPYRLIQEVMRRTRYDGYLFNDADDWSARERLEVLLAEAERTGAELIGSQEVRIHCDQGEAVAYGYPLDANEALREQPCSFPLLHPTSLISRDLVMRLGGFATAMRFSGDAELLRRAGHVARVVNVPEHLYFRRKRPGALTTSPETGLRSPARLEVQRVLWERARSNAARVAAGESPDLTPLAVAGPVHLTHLCGPRLRSSSRSGAPVPAPAAFVGHARPGARAAFQERRAATAPGPVFVVGAPRSGSGLVAWSLVQHPDLRASPGAAWVGQLVLRLQSVLETAGTAHGRAGRETPRWTEEEFWCAFGGAVGRLVPERFHGRWVDGTPENVFHVHGLLQLFPGALFIHVVRDVASVVESLVHAGTSDGSYYTEDTAVEQWLSSARAGLAAERTLGSRRVLRVRHADLVTSPETTLRRCLAHLDETFSPACLRPLAGLEAGPPAPVHGDAASFLRRQAERLSRDLLAEADPGYPPSPQLLPEMAREYRARSVRDARAPAATSTVDRVREVVRTAVPHGSTVLVVSRGDDELLALEGTRAWHFPRTADGTYAGHHPADSEEALAHLDHLRRSGAEYLLLPCTAFWWLDHYPGLRAYLERHCRLTSYQENAGVLYALPPAGGDPEGARVAPVARPVPAVPILTPASGGAAERGGSAARQTVRDAPATPFPEDRR